MTWEPNEHIDERTIQAAIDRALFHEGINYETRRMTAGNGWHYKVMDSEGIPLLLYSVWEENGRWKIDSKVTDEYIELRHDGDAATLVTLVQEAINHKLETAARHAAFHAQHRGKGETGERGEDLVELPSRSGDRRKWVQVWDDYGRLWKGARSLEGIAKTIRRKNEKEGTTLPAGEETLRKIFAAGEKGQLD